MSVDDDKIGVSRDVNFGSTYLECAASELSRGPVYTFRPCEIIAGLVDGRSLPLRVASLELNDTVLGGRDDHCTRPAVVTSFSDGLASLGRFRVASDQTRPALGLHSLCSAKGEDELSTSAGEEMQNSGTGRSCSTCETVTVLGLGN